MSIHDVKSSSIEFEFARSVRPAIKARFPSGSTFLPPSLSIAFPTRGPKKAATRRAAVKAMKKVSVAIPMDSEMGTAKIAGR
jgi:hypothetical protein